MEGCMKLSYQGNVVVLLAQLCHLEDSQPPEFKSFLTNQYCPSSTVPEWLNDVIREYLLEKYTSSFTVMGTFNSDSWKQLNSCWYFLSLECEMENWLSWITKIEPKLMMELSLVLSVRQLHNGQNHLISDSKISGFKNLERKELIFGDHGIASMSNVSS